tara:strand:- start:853 stop:1017 length:165 start_codon:yes stop_codon:yes gene_type:complete
MPQIMKTILLIVFLPFLYLIVLAQLAFNKQQRVGAMILSKFKSTKETSEGLLVE